ncbi:MAG TPA: response regulator [Bryobacteraceae bacterium]|nr:response regulator [Bryobacteraceae bacterium]
MSRSAAGHILLATDDNGTDREVRLAFNQSAPGWTIDLVRSRREIDSAKTANLVLLDLMLSHEQPFELLRWLRTEPRYREVPVFVLGSTIVADNVSEAYTLGANSCLLKESDPQGFSRIVHAVAAYATLIGGTGSSCTA